MTDYINITPKPNKPAIKQVVINIVSSFICVVGLFTVTALLFIL